MKLNVKSMHLVNNQRGMTMIELIMVLVILAIVMTFLAGRLFGFGEKAKQDLSKLRMQDLKSKIELFQLQYSSLPTSLDDLIRCTEKTGQGCAPLANEEALKDAWGNRLQYQVQDGRHYQLKSLGADGRDGGDGTDFDITLTGP